MWICLTAGGGVVVMVEEEAGFADEGYAAEPLPPPPTPIKVRDSHS